MQKTELEKAMGLVEQLEDDRQRADEYFKEITEWILPYRGFWPVDSDDEQAILERGQKVINPAATLAVERAAGGMTSGITPEGLPWLGLQTQNEQLMESAGVRPFLGYAENLLYAAFRQGGLYEAIHTFNLELEAFANSLLFMDYSPKTLIRFEAVTVGTFAVAFDEERELTTVARRLRWPAKALEKKFGRDKLSDRTKKILDLKPHKKVDVVHLVRPNEKFDPNKIDKMSMAYESLLFEPIQAGDDGPKDYLSKSGYHEMPYMFAWWSNPGDSDYAVGPGHQIVGHTKQLQEMERQKLIALQKMVSPPLLKPASMKNRMVTTPNGENAVSNSDSAGVRTLYEVNVPLQYLMQDIEKVEYRIAAVAKADLFYDMPMEMRPKEMTATEYMERKRERLQQIAPVYSIYEPNVLDKIVERGYNMLDRAGLLPPAPPQLAEQGTIEVEYQSSVAKALRQSGVESTRSLLLEVRGMAELQVAAGQKPTVLHKIDMAQAVDEIASGVGAPARIVRDDETYEAELQAANEAEAQMMQAQMEKEAMDSAAKMGGVRTEGTVAGKMLEAE